MENRNCENINVNQSLAIFKKISSNNHYDLLYRRISKSSHYQILSDGYKNGIISNYNAHLYRCILKKNISHVNCDNELNVVENLFEQNNFKLPIENYSDLINLKFSLIIQGLTIEEKAIEYIGKNNKIKDATFNAVDITIFDNLKVNSPINIPFVELSPFCIRYNSLNGLGLYYDDMFISAVSIDTEDNLPTTTTNNSIPYKSIAFRTNDRVRIRHSSVCSFKQEGLSYAFCESKHKQYFKLPLEDIFEVIDTYEKNIDFRHYLIGGASGIVGQEHHKIIEIASYIRKKSKKPIYLMSIPPQDIEIIKQYYEAGITEVAFNLEVYDRNIAKQIMPGKGEIPLEQYINAFNESVKYFGRTGNVRSMLIVGLEPQSSLFKGVEHLASLGVSPMLSALRPMPNTIFRDVIANSVSHFSEIYLRAKTICKKYNVELGPSCEACQNNIMILPNSYYNIINN